MSQLHPEERRQLLLHAFELFRRPNPSGQERLVREYVVQQLEAAQFTVEHDAVGNVLATHGQTASGVPVLSFHMDSVESPRWEPLQLRPLQALRYEAGIIHSRQKVILGGDDKCGAAIALTIAATTSCPLKIVASVEEERGCLGIVQTPVSFFADGAYALVLDRRGHEDVITSIAGVPLCSPDFAQGVVDAAASLGQVVKPTGGSLSDAVHLSRLMDNVVNLSVGYYLPHTPQEYVVAEQLIQAYAWVQSALHSLPCDLPAPRLSHACSGCSRSTFSSTPLCRWCHARQEEELDWL